MMKAMRYGVMFESIMIKTCANETPLAARKACEEYQDGWHEILISPWT